MYSLTWTFLIGCTVLLFTAKRAEGKDKEAGIKRPPTIFTDDLIDDLVYYDEEDESGVELPCQAHGNPPIYYSWTKNGISLDLKDPMYVLKNEYKGTIIVTDLMEQVNGYYQCKAENRYGISYSNKILLKKATRRPFANQKTKRFRQVEGSFLKIECNPPDNDPPASVRWVRYSDKGKAKQYVWVNRRIAMDLEGNLYFANVEKDDANDGEMYACESSLEQFGGIKMEGAHSTIEVISEGPSPGPLQPTEIMYRSPDKVTALIGDDIAFKCIISGNPTPNIQWVKKDGDLDDSRMQARYHSLYFRDIQYDDAGFYFCIGRNSVLGDGPSMGSFALTVESRPTWTSKPVAVNTNGSGTVTFECKAEGKPPPRINWFINGVPIEDTKPDPRRFLSQGQLKIINLDKDDAQVIQCNASNVHDYLWADVALSIIDEDEKSACSYNVASDLVLRAFTAVVLMLMKY